MRINSTSHLKSNSDTLNHKHSNDNKISSNIKKIIETQIDHDHIIQPAVTCFKNQDLLRYSTCRNISPNIPMYIRYQNFGRL